jgi:hypothetical protein
VLPSAFSIELKLLKQSCKWFLPNLVAVHKLASNFKNGAFGSQSLDLASLFELGIVPKQLCRSWYYVVCTSLATEHLL